MILNRYIPMKINNPPFVLRLTYGFAAFAAIESVFSDEFVMDFGESSAFDFVFDGVEGLSLAFLVEMVNCYLSLDFCFEFLSRIVAEINFGCFGLFFKFFGIC